MYLIFPHYKWQWKQRQQTENNYSSSWLTYSTFPWLRCNQTYEFKAGQEEVILTEFSDSHPERLFIPKMNDWVFEGIFYLNWTQYLVFAASLFSMLSDKSAKMANATVRQRQHICFLLPYSDKVCKPNWLSVHHCTKQSNKYYSPSSSTNWWITKLFFSIMELGNKSK